MSKSYTDYTGSKTKDSSKSMPKTKDKVVDTKSPDVTTEMVGGKPPKKRY